MNKITITNIDTYKSIADEAFSEMVQLLNAGRRPKADGNEGWIVTIDPSQRSFKKAMISIVFTGMWLEALCHLKIVERFGEEKYKEYDFKSYEDKLELLGVTDIAIIQSVKQFRTTRKELVHEKAYFDKGKMKVAQKEAECAHEMLHTIHAKFLKQG